MKLVTRAVCDRREDDRRLFWWDQRGQPGNLGNHRIRHGTRRRLRDIGWVNYRVVFTGRHLDLPQPLECLPPGKTALQRVPVRDPHLSRLPAEIDLLAVSQAPEVDQTHRHILELAT